VLIAAAAITTGEPMAFAMPLVTGMTMASLAGAEVTEEFVVFSVGTVEELIVSFAGTGAEELVVLSDGVEEFVALSVGVNEELVVLSAGTLADWLAVSFTRMRDELVVFAGMPASDWLAADMQEQRKVAPRNKTNRFKNSLDSICTKPRQVRCAKD
jgi:hypothetical protein